MALGEDITGEQFLLGLNKLSKLNLLQAHLFGGLVLFMENDRYLKSTFLSTISNELHILLRLDSDISLLENIFYNF